MVGRTLARAASKCLRATTLATLAEGKHDGLAFRT
jgi:hypothetical protein